MRNIRTASELILFLVKLGYRYCKPAARTWSSAMVMKRDASVLCVLFRKNGVDLRYYERYNGEIRIDARNVGHILGGMLVRNHYNEADNFIHLKVAVIASCFSTGTLREELWAQEGRSYRLNPKYQRIREESRERFEQRSQEMRDEADERGLWDYLREDCGGYLGDGDWI